VGIAQHRGHTRECAMPWTGVCLGVALVKADQDLSREVLVSHHVLSPHAVEGCQVTGRLGVPYGLRPHMEVLIAPCRWVVGS